MKLKSMNSEKTKILIEKFIFILNKVCLKSKVYRKKNLKKKFYATNNKNNVYQNLKKNIKKPLKHYGKKNKL